MADQQAPQQAAPPPAPAAAAPPDDMAQIQQLGSRSIQVAGRRRDQGAQLLPALGQDREPLSVSIAKDGKIYLQKQLVTEDELVPKLTAISNNGYDQRIFVRGDRTVDYGKVMEVMGLLNSAGFTRIGLVTDSQRRQPEP